MWEINVLDAEKIYAAFSACGDVLRHTYVSTDVPQSARSDSSIVRHLCEVKV